MAILEGFVHEPGWGLGMIAPDLTRLSPNYNRDANGVPLPLTTKTVVIHATRSGRSMNPTEFVGTLGYMATPGTVSSHWVISRTGVAARVVPDNHQAWHAGVDNDNTWGIEMEQGVEADGFTEPQIARLIDVCRGYVADFGVAPVRVFTSFVSGFVGHQDTVQGQSFGKSDPGKLFPWDDFIRRLQPAGFDELAYLRTLINVGDFITKGIDLKGIAPWQKDAYDEIGRKMR